METLVDIINSLNQKGYTLDFNKPDLLAQLRSKPENFRIEKIFRYDGNTNPDDESIVYGLASKSKNEKGVLVDGYGIYAVDEIEQILNKMERI